MKGFVVALLSMASLMFSSCLGCNGCLLAMEGCGEDHNDGYCDICGGTWGYNTESVTDGLEICTQCIGDGDDYGCGGCF